MKKWLAGEAVSGGPRGPTRNRREGVSARRRRLMPLWVVACLAMVAGVSIAPASYAQVVTPLPPVACPTNLGSCTAGDVVTTVTSASVLPSDPTCSGPTDTVDIRLNLSFDPTANARYDLGVYISNNGGNVNGGSLCSGAPGPIGPFIDLDLRQVPPDAPNTCGDINATTTWSVTSTVKCNVVGGQLTIPSCRVWDQNKKNDAVACTTLSNAGTGSKCDCSSLVIPVQSIAFGTLTVVKKLVPTNDPGKFNLTIDGVVNATDVVHDGTTGAVTVNVGQHTVGEIAGTGTNLENYGTTISCTDGSSSTTNSVTGVNVVANQNTTCTITNTRNTVQACRILRLKSTGAVGLTGQPTPTRPLFGTGAFNATCTGASCTVQIKTGVNEGMFTGNGLIYNDGQFGPGLTCTAAWYECFPNQNPSPPLTVTQTGVPPNDFNLTGLVLTSNPAGGTITFGAGTYSYTGGEFAAHSGTYRTTECTSTVPEPGTLMLMLPLVLVLLALSGLGLARRRQVRQRSGSTAARIH